MANKTINGRQCTIIWHVDDLKISHVEKEVVEDIIKLLNKKIWKRKSANYHKRQGIRIPGDDTGLFDKRKGEDIHVQLHRQTANRIALRHEWYSEDTSCVTFI